ncbi:MAG: hypothetical protein AAFQ12_02485 [Pseudomonadota bacterium]
MKALLICSVRSLFPITELEAQACNLAFAKSKLDLAWGVMEVAKVQAAGTLPNALVAVGEAVGVGSLLDDYLDALNELIWNATPVLHNATEAALKCALDQRVPRGFVSEYPLLTTNLARSAALRTGATRLGEICVPSTLNVPFDPKAALESIAQSLDLVPSDCTVLVASMRDQDAAASAGMTPRLIQEASLASGPKMACVRKQRHGQVRANVHQMTTVASLRQFQI